MITAATRHVSWQKINYRQTDSLLAAEFLHGLYQRHDPFLNPFRFANTVVAFKPWTATSYAPEQEWDRLAVRFGGRILANPDLVLTELDRVLANPRTRSRELAQRLESMAFERLTDEDLAETLVQMHHVPLGEIYEVNLVQVEHSLHAAARALVADHGDHSGELLARLVRSETPTAGGRSEREFLDLVAQARAAEHDPTEVREELGRLAIHHRELGSGYGARTATLDEIEHRFQQYLGLDDTEFERRLDASRGVGTAALDLPADRGDLQRVLDSLRRTGDVRDANKKLLGLITRHRERMLEEVAGRCAVPSEAVRLYSLEELLRLVGERVETPDEILARRFSVGVVFRRAESFDFGDVAAVDKQGYPSELQSSRGSDVLHGTCASPGIHSGRVTVIGSASDLARMSVGDVLVAAGTDFDVLLLLQMAGAIVTEEGGLLSHAAVVARELGIPCLIGVSDACQLLHDGQQVIVNATEGRLEVVAPRGSHEPATAEPLSVLDSRLVPLDAGLPVELIGRKASGLLWLRSIGLDTPQDCQVLMSDTCQEIVGQVASGSEALLRSVAGEIVEASRGGLLSLRSSSVLEDGDDATAAGIYHSEVAVTPDVQAVADALLRVLTSRRSERSEAYHRRLGRSDDAPLAVLVAPYLSFTYQGTAFSHSPWSEAHAAVEYFESDGLSGCPDGGGTIVHIGHAGLTPPLKEHPIPHIVGDLSKVAEIAYQVSSALGTPAEIEWGIRNHKIVVLQARSVGQVQVSRR